MTKDRRLGRGLAALLGEPESEVGLGDGSRPQSLTAAGDLGGAGGVVRGGEVAAAEAHRPHGVVSEPGDQDLMLSVSLIEENPFQPRREFGESEIASLAESLKEHDLLQPVLVRRIGTRYQLISGERRLRAARYAGWQKIPARIREADDRLVAELAIVENLQRKDLNPIEKALSFQRYLQQHQCTQEDLGKRIKIDRSTIANLMRLLELPAEVQRSLQEGKITAGHARALLPLGDPSAQREFARRIMDEGLSVRDTERQVGDIVRGDEPAPGLHVVGGSPSQAPSRRAAPGGQIASLEQDLRRALGTKVEIKSGARGRGKIVIQFKNHDEFERLYHWLLDEGPPKTARAAS